MGSIIFQDKQIGGATIASPDWHGLCNTNRGRAHYGLRPARKGLYMAICSTAKETFEVWVGALTTFLGINSSQLSFLWEEPGQSAQSGFDGQPEDKLEAVGICLDESWSILIFTESELRDLDHLSDSVRLQRRGEILEVLRKLKGLNGPVLESERPDFWASEGYRLSPKRI